MKRSIIFSLLFLIGFSASAQDSYLQNRFNLKLGVTESPYARGWRKSILGTDWNPLFIGELNYGWLPWLEAGLYTGYSQSLTSSINPDFEETNNDPLTKYILAEKPVLYYGLNTNAHLLPMLINGKNFRFDVYVTAKIGAEHLIGKGDMDIRKTVGFDYLIGAGAAYYLTRHLGVYGEYGFGNNKKWRVGVSYKIRRD